MLEAAFEDAGLTNALTFDKGGILENWSIIKLATNVPSSAPPQLTAYRLSNALLTLLILPLFVNPVLSFQPPKVLVQNDFLRFFEIKHFLTFLWRENYSLHWFWSSRLFLILQIIDSLFSRPRKSFFVTGKYSF